MWIKGLISQLFVLLFPVCFIPAFNLAYKFKDVMLDLHDVVISTRKESVKQSNPALMINSVFASPAVSESFSGMHSVSININLAVC